jgi:hypothetical protein
MDRRDPPPEQVDDDRDAHWAIPALERLRAQGPPRSGVVGDERYHDHPPLGIPDRQIPPPPADMTDLNAVEKWRTHCWMLRNIFGSGN